MSRNSLGNLHKLIATTRGGESVVTSLPLEVMFLNSLEQTITLRIQSQIEVVHIINLVV